MFDCVQVPLGRIIAKNAPEWWIIALGLIAAAISGTLFPAFAVFFGEVLAVLALPPGQVLDGVHLWAGLFIILAIASGVFNFLKVWLYSCHVFWLKLMAIHISTSPSDLYRDLD